MLHRQEFTTTIRELNGKRAESLQVMLAVRPDGDEDVLHVLLKIHGGRVHKLFLDTGILFWSELKSPDDDDTNPEACAEAGSVAELRTVPVAGRTIQSIKMDQQQGHGALDIQWQEGGGITLRSEAESTDAERTRLLLR